MNILSTGSYLPQSVIFNTDFHEGHKFDQFELEKPGFSTTEIDRFESITGIKERRYAEVNETTLDMAVNASKIAIEAINLNASSIDVIIFAHNWVNTLRNNNITYNDQLPNLASRLKNSLGIKNPNCLSLDILFGCAGFLEAINLSSLLLASRGGKHALIVGGDTISRVIDFSDRDSMLFSDGAGAFILEKKNDSSQGFIAHKSLSFCESDVAFLEMRFQDSEYPDFNNLFLKMNGKKVFQTALKYSIEIIKDLLHEHKVPASEIKYLIIHQANSKMIKIIKDELIKSLNFNKDVIMPITVDKYGNNSVATIPICYDELLRGNLPSRKPQKDDKVLFISFGAGMHINTSLYVA